MKSFSTLSEIHSEIKAGTLTVPDLVRYHLDKIKDNGRLNAFLSVYADDAMAQAQAIQAKFESEKQGKLAGLIVGIKDVFALKGKRLQAASKILDGFESLYTATAIQRLIDEDAIIIGHQNCDEFAMGSSNENSAFGPTKNPKDDTRVPGGSSGGSSAAVAAEMCRISIGSDTGGSVRQPAAFCGVLGLKPTYSRISRYGLAAYASSFDTVGIIGKSVEDIALVLEVMAGPDDFDSTVARTEVPSYSKLFSEENYNIGYLNETVTHESLNDDVKEAFFDVLEQLEAQGHDVSEAHFSRLNYLLPAYYILTGAEASSNLSRYDGMRFGVREEGSDLEKTYKASRSKGFGEEVKRRIMAGTFVLSASYYDAYYKKAQKVRALVKEETDLLFEKYDFLVSPTTPATAFCLGDLKDSQEMYLQDLYTVQANVAGVPAISIPMGEDSNGLPMGFQIMSKAFNESQLLDISNQIATFKYRNK
ncbi:MAG: Asp-tRNA(Asn)/Glu-tRNA(Gln) amidotransferase subunit GatA [Ekhidna sp.]|nr:Asp-tRNA(Asn)/Glu-tRNA(Gln) amidotransferase subunit GatA [Ekhidna sp.]